MSLLDRYVHAVRKHLPKGQQDDIAAELRDTLQSQIEAEEATRGRRLTDNEEAAIFTKFGRPIAVAARYGSQEYLIGPALFPYYRFVLKVLAWIGIPVIVFAVVVTALANDNPLASVADVIGTAVSLAFATVGVVTLVFSRFERLKLDLSKDWDPRELPRLDDGSKTIPRSLSLNGAIAMTVYLLWWVDLLPINPAWLIGWHGADAPMRLSPAWQVVYLPITLLLIVDVVCQWINVWRPRVEKWRIAVEVAGDVGGLAVIYYLVNAGDLLVITRQSWLSAAERINDGFTWFLMVLGVLIAIGLIDEVRRLFAPSGSAPQPAAVQ